MEIEYNFTIDDVVALSLWHNLQTKTFKNSVKKGRIFLPLGSLLLLSLVSWVTKTYYYVAAGFVSLIVLFFWIPDIMRKSAKDQVRKTIDEVQGKGAVGKMELSISPEKVTEKSETGVGSSSWDAVKQIIETVDHVFIYGGVAKSYIIPKRTLPEETISEFIAKATDYHKKFHKK